MSDTPLTDSATSIVFLTDGRAFEAADPEVSRQIERELVAANERIKRLEEHSNLLTEAGNEVFWSLCPSSTSMMTERERDALKAWNKAKDAKRSEP